MDSNEINIKISPIGPIPGDWELVKLKDVTSKIGSGATPRGGHLVYIKEGINFIRSQNVYDHHFKSDGLVHITEDAAKKLNNVALQHNDILLNITGHSIARCCMVPDSMIPSRVNQHVSIIRTTEDIDPYFIALYLCLPQVKRYMVSHDSGGTRKALTKGMIENFLIPKPPRDEQKAIADILWTLNEKIELNGQMNKTLEEIAQVIFKSWFVDFEPFKDGEFEYNEELEKEIPKEWEVVQMSDIAKVTSGKRPNTIYENQSQDSPVSVYGGSGVMGYTIESLFTEPILVTGRVGTLGKLYRANLPSWPSDNTLVVIVKDKYYFEFVYFFLQQTKLESLNRGTSNPLITQGDIKRQKLALPPSNTINSFSSTCRTLFEQCSLNNYECRILTKIRDTLLPKLLTGEIRVGMEVS